MAGFEPAFPEMELNVGYAGEDAPSRYVPICYRELLATKASSAQVREAEWLMLYPVSYVPNGAAGVEPATLSMYALPVRARTTLPVGQSSTSSACPQALFSIWMKLPLTFAQVGVLDDAAGG